MSLPSQNATSGMNITITRPRNLYQHILVSFLRKTKLVKQALLQQGPKKSIPTWLSVSCLFGVEVLSSLTQRLTAFFAIHSAVRLSSLDIIYLHQFRAKSCSLIGTQALQATIILYPNHSPATIIRVPPLAKHQY